MLWTGSARRALPSTTAPGSNAVFSFNVTAPSSPGTYNFQWKMLEGPSYWFGAQSTNVAVNVTPSSPDANVFFIHTDHLNTPRLVANSSGATVWRWDQQEPFGINVPDQNPSGLGSFEFNLRFPGQYADKETNLFYNYFRIYDAAIGRYAQSDPIGLRAGPNTYAYVGGRPISFRDAYGLAVVCRPTPRGIVCIDVPGGSSGAGGIRPPTSGNDDVVVPFPGGRDRPSERPSRPTDRPTTSDNKPGDKCTCRFTGHAESDWIPPADPGYEDLSPYGRTGYATLKCWYKCPGPGKKGWGYTIQPWGGGNLPPEELARFCQPEVPDDVVTIVH